MAQEAPAQAVGHQPGAAVGAAQPVPAGAAQAERREAAPVEEQERLLAGRQRVGESATQARRQPGTARRAVVAQVDQRDLGHGAAAMARRQHERRSVRPGVVSHPSQAPGSVEGGRCRDQDRGAALEPGAGQRQVAAVVGDALVLFEAGVVLLVDHDQAERRQRQEQRRARPDHDRLATLGDTPPGAPARRRAELGMPERRGAAEALGEALEELRGQRDLGQEDQHLAAALEGARHRLEIDLGLAGTGHPFEQGDAVPRRQARAERAGRPRLRGRQHGGPLVERQGGGRRLGQRYRDQEARPGHRLHHAGADACAPRDLGRAARHAIRDRGQHPAARRAPCHRCRGLRRRHQALLRGRRLERGRRAQHQLQGAAQRRQRHRGDMLDQATQGRWQGRGVEAPSDRLEPRRLDRPVGRTAGGAHPGIPHRADHLARPERHLDQVARRHDEIVGQRVVERPVERQRDQDRNRARHRGAAPGGYSTLRETGRSRHCRQGEVIGDRP